MIRLDKHQILFALMAFSEYIATTHLSTPQHVSTDDLKRMVEICEKLNPLIRDGTLPRDRAALAVIMSTVNELFRELENLQ